MLRVTQYYFMDKVSLTIGIGASAGGQESLCNFFDHLSADLNVVIVVVTHLMRDRISVLSQILSGHTQMKVISVKNDMPVVSGRIYVLKENTYLEIKNGWLHIIPRDTAVQNSAVDIFFKSLAEDSKEKAIGIILSGGGQDGLEGATKIYEMGGIVLAEDPKSARFNGMPLAISKYGHPTAVLKPAELALFINHICSLLQNNGNNR